MLNQVPYTYKKRGIFYYNRMVPSDLDDHYESRRVNFSLRTRSIRTARQSASATSLKLEGYWQYLRLNKTSLPGSNLIRTNSSNSTTSPTHPFSDAVQLYLDLKGLNKAKTFHSALATDVMSNDDRNVVRMSSCFIYCILL